MVFCNGVPSEKAIKKQGIVLLKVRDSAQEVRDSAAEGEKLG
jgi:hypothetical protein